MALSWDQIGKIANVAQFTGIGGVELIGNLIGMVVDTATVARTHKENCREFARYMKLIYNLLKPLRNSELKRYPGAQELFDLIEGAVRRSYNLAKNCQDWNYFKRFIWGQNIVNQLKEAQNKIDQYLKIIPLIILGNDARNRESGVGVKKSVTKPAQDEAMDKKKKKAAKNNKDEAMDKKKKQARTNKKKDEAIGQKKKKAGTNKKRTAKK